MKLNQYEMETIFYTISLGGVYFILGVQWLQTLGTYSANHQKQFIKFKMDGRKYKLLGFQVLPTQIISSQQMKKLIPKEAPVFVAQCQQLELLSMEGIHQQSENTFVIQKYDKVFQELPMKLPLKGKLNISLKSNQIRHR